ncbi:MAG: hypothetical protein NZM43_09625 [Saprospiraceae bacterium]|nr:hypothetical protein [Saprospiraceae bacterium]MDW8484575.1 hypothetical protein [Saprospiraceae bacterium]
MSKKVTTTSQLVEALDSEILRGNITGAFEQFAAEDCVTWSTPEHKTTSKAQKKEILDWFFQNIARVNRIERQGVRVEGDVTLSQFVFDFTNRQGENLVYQEVIRRVWRNGQVVEEQYLLNKTLDEIKEVLEKKAVKKTSEKPVEAEPAPAPAAPKSKTSSKKATAKKTSKERIN